MGTRVNAFRVLTWVFLLAWLGFSVSVGIGLRHHNFLLALFIFWILGFGVVRYFSMKISRRLRAFLSVHGPLEIYERHGLFASPPGGPHPFLLYAFFYAVFLRFACAWAFFLFSLCNLYLGTLVFRQGIIENTPLGALVSAMWPYLGFWPTTGAVAGLLGGWGFGLLVD